MLGNVIKTLVSQWKTSVVRIPICGSAWAQNYVVHDWGNAEVATYRDFSGACASLMKPLPWADTATFTDLTSH